MNLSPEQRRLVLQAVDEGLRKSAEQLSRISKQNWAVTSSVLSDGPGQRFRAVLGGSIQPFYGAYLPMQDGRPLAVLVLFPVKDARALAESFTAGYGPRVRQIADFEKAALSEIANILAHAMAGALADLLSDMLILASPKLSAGPRLSLFDAALAQFKAGESFVLLSGLSLQAPAAASECSLAILADNAMLSALLEASR